MNRGNKIAVILVVLFSTLTFWSVVRNKRGTINEALKDFAIEDTGSVTKIFLADRENNKITLQKVKPGLWKLNDKYVARNEAVKLLLYTMKSIEVKQPVGKKAKENVIRQLASRSIKVEIYQNDKLTKVYYVGEETLDHLGTYMLLSDPETGENYSMPFVMYIPGFDGYLTPRYITNVADWRGRIVFSIIPTEISSVKVEYTEAPESSFELSVPSEKDFQLKQLKTGSLIAFDTMAVKQYLSYYKSINFESLLNDAMPEADRNSIVSGPFAYSIEVTDISGQKNLVKLYHKPADPDKLDENGEPLKYDLDRMYALINNGNDFVMVQFYTFGKLLQPLEYFAVRKGTKPAL